MGIFNFGKNKKQTETKSCCCSTNFTFKAVEAAENEKQCSGVKVLGSGCSKCHQLEESTLQALADLGMDTTIEHVTDFTKIASYGVMTTPALVVDGKVVSYGKLLSKNEVIELIKKVRDN